MYMYDEKNIHAMGCTVGRNEKISTIKMVFTCLESMYTLYPVIKHKTLQPKLVNVALNCTQTLSHYEYAPMRPLEYFLLKRQIDTPACFHKSQSIVKSWRPFCIPNHVHVHLDGPVDAQYGAFYNNRPIYIGKKQNPKNLGFLLYRLHCQKNP